MNKPDIYRVSLVLRDDIKPISIIEATSQEQAILIAGFNKKAIRRKVNIQKIKSYPFPPATQKIRGLRVLHFS